MLNTSAIWQQPVYTTYQLPSRVAHQELRKENQITIIGGSCHKYHICRDKVLLQQAHVRACRDNTRLLSKQKHACHNKTFVTTKYFCFNKTFVATNIILSQRFVTTNTCLSQQNTSFVATKLCKYLLSWQKWYLWQLPPMINNRPEIPDRSRTTGIPCLYRGGRKRERGRRRRGGGWEGGGERSVCCTALINETQTTSEIMLRLPVLHSASHF